MKTFISDNAIYRVFCRLAATNDETFMSFKRDPRYTAILEHVSQEQGAAYLKIIEKTMPEILKNPAKLRRNDQFGNPQIFDYPPYGKFSPTTLRYAKVASDLASLFGTLDGMRIVEIGGGYGGQCEVLGTFFPDIISYAIIDLQECQQLQKRYLNMLGTTKYSDNLMGSFDLVISNYAFSECERTIQQAYIDGIVRRTLRTYMTCNFFSQQFGVDSMPLTELLEKLPGATVRSEEPLTAVGNCILTRGPRHDPL